MVPLVLQLSNCLLRANADCLLLQNLAEIKGLSDAKIDKMVEAARKCDTKAGWQTAASVEKQVAIQNTALTG